MMKSGKMKNTHHCVMYVDIVNAITTTKKFSKSSHHEILFIQIKINKYLWR